ncbi:hypothetical protein BC830DRAFT_1105695 [Chytriomyces sp. MP71]|nr:hypothetical protein BC830DRAFT_1105695 [Chytriomyces sp. MP71]
MQAFSFIKTPLFTPRRHLQLTLPAPPPVPVYAPDSPDSDDFYGSPNLRERDYTSSSDSGSSRDDTSSIHSISPAELKPVHEPWESRDWSCFSVKRCDNPRVSTTTLLSVLLQNYSIAPNPERKGRSKSVVPRRRESNSYEATSVLSLQTRSISLAPPAMRKNASIKSRYSCYSITSDIHDDISWTTPSIDTDSHLTHPKAPTIETTRSKSQISVFIGLFEKRPASTPSIETTSSVSPPTSLMTRVKSLSPRLSRSSPPKHLSVASSTSSRYIPRPATLLDYTSLFHLILAASTPRPHSLLRPLPEPPALQFSRSMYAVAGRGVRLEVRGGRWVEWEMPVVAGFDLSWETVCAFKNVGCLRVTGLVAEGGELGERT